MPIDSKHKDYDKYAPIWKRIKDITELENLGEYLIKLNPHDDSDDNRIRNEQYQKRAVFYPIAQHMANGLHSQLFSKEPELVVPTSLEYLLTNADGMGNSIYQQSQMTAYDVIRMSRAALYVSFPKTDGGVSVADMENGNFFATIHRFAPDQIINWQKTNIGSRSVLSRVIIQDKEQVFDDDAYEPEYRDIIKEFALNDGVFAERTWRKMKIEGGKEEWIPDAWYIPLDGNGNPWNEIPFTFVGSSNNDAQVDKPLLDGMVRINIGHYRNSADYEDSVWFAGQAQPWMSGVTQTHIDMMQENKMYVGSRNLIGVPAGETFGFASAPPNPLVGEAMLKKVELMVMMGASLMTQSGRERKEVEVLGEQQIQHSALSLISQNLSEAYTKAIEWCGRFMRTETTEAFYKTTTDFAFHKWSSDELREMSAGFVAGSIPPVDYFNWLKKVELTSHDKTLEEFMQEVNTTDSNVNLGE